MHFTSAESLERGDRLATAISIRTISFAPGKGTGKRKRTSNTHNEDKLTFPGEQNDTAFPIFSDFLNASFPLLHSANFVELLDLGEPGNPSRLYRISGTEDDEEDESNRQQPYLLAAHIDVVPPGDVSRWTKDPFDAGVVDGEVFGRGALDCKHTLMGVMEAIEYR